MWQGRVQRRDKDGRLMELDISVYPIFDRSGKFVNFSIIERDVTAQVHFQQAVHQMQKMEALGTLATGVAHDLNNILNPILLNTELVLDRSEPSGAQRDQLYSVLEAARRGRELVRRILAFGAREEKHREPVVLAHVVEETLRFLKSSLPANIRIAAAVEDRTSRVLADPVLLQQVLINLGINAAQAMGTEGGVLEVGLTSGPLEPEESTDIPQADKADYIKLTVSDTGCGIPPDARDRIFEPFFTTREGEGGTGMGLAVVHGIVKMHQGAVTARNKADAGATFRVYLPKTDEEVPPEREVGRAELSGGGERVLFVDDEPIQVETFRRVLGKLGYGFSGYSDSRRALAAFRRDPAGFDLIITDQTMPHLAGLKLAYAVLALRPDIPIILTTGYSESVDEDTARAAGIRGFLMKPFGIRDISEKIRSVLGTDTRSTTRPRRRAVTAGRTGGTKGKSGRRPGRI
jgi:signal transduction histidine kinase/ActR/RegA family two-component response regulator